MGDAPPVGCFVNRQSLSSRSWAALLVLLVILMPTLPMPLPGDPHDHKRWLQLLWFFGVGLALLVSGGLRSEVNGAWRMLARPARAGLVAILALGTASALAAASPMHAFIDVALMLWLVVGALVVSAAVRADPSGARSLAVGAVLATCTLYIGLFSIGYVTGRINQLPMFVDELYANFSHVRFFSQFQSWTLPLLTLPVMLARGLPRTALAFVVAIAWWALCIASGTRGLLLAMAVTMVMMPILYGAPGWRWSARQGAFAAGGGVLYWLLFARIELMSSMTGVGRVFSTDSSSRWQLYCDAWRMIRRSPILGEGPHHYADFDFQHLAAHPHNAALQIAGEWGLPAAMLLLWLIGWAAIAWWRALRAQCPAGERTQQVNVALSGALLCAGTHAMFSGTLVMPLSQVMLMGVLGWALGQYAGMRSPPVSGLHDEQVPMRGFVLAAVAVLGLLPLAWTAVTEGSDNAVRAQSYRVSTGRVLRPRMWRQGFFGNSLPSEQSPPAAHWRPPSRTSQCVAQH